jgi:hypothetical protein
VVLGAPVLGDNIKPGGSIISMASSVIVEARYQVVVIFTMHHRYQLVCTPNFTNRGGHSDDHHRKL